jgi:hypothetical protein
LRLPFIGLLALLAGCVTAPTSTTFREILLRNTGFEAANVLYLHGAGDDAKRWAQALVESRGGFAFDWKQAAADRLAAPGVGYQLGLAMATTMDPATQRVLYAHSAGAWVAQGIADGLALIPGSLPPTIVFLDPFTAFSLVDFAAGKTRLGKNARATTYFTTRDPIPFTDGGVAAGTVSNVDSLLDASVQGTPAHWAVIDWYFSKGPELVP